MKPEYQIKFLCQVASITSVVLVVMIAVAWAAISNGYILRGPIADASETLTDEYAQKLAKEAVDRLKMQQQKESDGKQWWKSGGGGDVRGLSEFAEELSKKQRREREKAQREMKRKMEKVLKARGGGNTIVETDDRKG